MKSIGTLLIAFMLVGQSLAQHQPTVKVFDPIPIAEHGKLSERLQKMVQYHRDEQWGKVFDLLPKVHNQHPEVTKREFIRRMSNGNMRILAFIPDSTTTNITIDAEYMIYGCAQTRWEERVGWYRAAVGTAFENKQWYFTPIYLISGIDAPPQPCTPKPASNKRLERTRR